MLSVAARELGQRTIVASIVPEKATQSPPQQGSPASEISASGEITYGSTLEEIMGAMQQAQREGEITEQGDIEMPDNGDL